MTIPGTASQAERSAGNDLSGTELSTLERWSLLNNKGYALHVGGDYQKAWNQHRLALQLAELHGMSQQQTISQVEVAGSVIKLGLDAEASALLASALASTGLTIRLRRRVNELLSELFELDGDWSEALLYWSHALPLIDTSDKSGQFWWRQQNGALLIKASRLGAAEQELERAQDVIDRLPPTHDDAWFGHMLLLRRAELAGAHGEISIALSQVATARASLKEQGRSHMANEAGLSEAELLLTAGSYDRLFEVTDAISHNMLSHQSSVRLGRYRAEALKQVGRWQEASEQLESLIHTEQQRETNAHSVYLLQEEIATSETVRAQNRELAEANEVLSLANQDRARLMELIRRDLQSQLVAAVDAWSELPSAESSTDRLTILRRATAFVDRLSETAAQVVEVRLLEANEVDLNPEEHLLADLLDTASSSLSTSLYFTNKVDRKAKASTDAAHFLSAIRHVLAAFSSELRVGSTTQFRNIVYSDLRTEEGDGFEILVGGPNLKADGHQEVGADTDFVDVDIAASFDRGLVDLHLGRELLTYLGFDVTVDRHSSGTVTVRAISSDSEILFGSKILD